MSEQTPVLTRAERNLIAELLSWARRNGWTRSSRGWINGRSEAEATVIIGFDPGWVSLWRKPEGRTYFLLGSDDYPVRSVREAVDLLCALRILPVEFSSGYAAAVAAFRQALGEQGVKDLLGAVADGDVDRLRVALAGAGVAR